MAGFINPSGGLPTYQGYGYGAGTTPTVVPYGSGGAPAPSFSSGGGGGGGYTPMSLSQFGGYQTPSFSYFQPGQDVTSLLGSITDQRIRAQAPQLQEQSRQFDVTSGMNKQQLNQKLLDDQNRENVLQSLVSSPYASQRNAGYSMLGANIAPAGGGGGGGGGSGYAQPTLGGTQAQMLQDIWAQQNSPAEQARQRQLRSQSFGLL